MKIKYERTSYGWKAFALEDGAKVYFGHFYSKREAVDGFMRRQESEEETKELVRMYQEQGQALA